MQKKAALARAFAFGILLFGTACGSDDSGVGPASDGGPLLDGTAEATGSETDGIAADRSSVDATGADGAIPDDAAGDGAIPDSEVPEVATGEDAATDAPAQEAAATDAGAAKDGAADAISADSSAHDGAPVDDGSADAGATLALTPAPFAATQSVAFHGTVVTVTDADVSDVASSLTATIDWGDGTAVIPGTVAGSSGSFSVSSSHTYSVHGSFMVTVTVNRPSTLASASAKVSATVNPQLVASGTPFGATQSVAFNGAVAAVTDAITSDTVGSLSATIDWGDGTAAEVAFVVAGASAGNFNIAGSHAYATPGTFMVTVTVQDPSTLASASAKVSATVNPQLVASGTPFGATQSVAFNGAVAAVTDAITSDTVGSLSATIDWGDGTAAEVAFVVAGASAGNFNIAGSHTYTTSGQVVVTITVTDPSTQATASTRLAVDVSPQLHVSAAPFSATKSVAFNGDVATVVDAITSDTVGSLSAAIDWGDGTAAEVAFVVAGTGAGNFSIAGSHTYATSGSVTVVVTVSDPTTGATGSTQYTVNVAP